MADQGKDKACGALVIFGQVIFAARIAAASLSRILRFAK